MLVHMFNLEISALAASKKTWISYPTVHRAFGCMRYAITQHLADTDRALRGRIEADETYFGGKRKGNRGRKVGNKQIVFGIKERNGRVRVNIVKNVRASTLARNASKMIKKGSMIYAGQWTGYNTLVAVGFKHKSVNHSKLFKKGSVHTNGIEGFWSYAKEKLAKHHGVSAENFVYYIKEMERRYNNRNRDLDLVLLGYLLT